MDIGGGDMEIGGGDMEIGGGGLGDGQKTGEHGYSKAATAPVGPTGDAAPEPMKADRKKFPCDPPCAYSTDKKGNLVRHKDSNYCYHNCPIHCQFCVFGFLTESSLSEHLRRRWCPKQFACPNCDMHFSTETDLIIHMATHK
jgi:hypothetical protein